MPIWKDNQKLNIYIYIVDLGGIYYEEKEAIQFITGRIFIRILLSVGEYKLFCGDTGE